jgi:hypothetical protein
VEAELGFAHGRADDERTGASGSAARHQGNWSGDRGDPSL